MLADGLLRERFLGRLERLIELAELEVTIAELERQKFGRPVHKARALLRRLMGVR